MIAFIWLIDTVSTLAVYFIVASVVLNWLLAFDILNRRQTFVRMISEALYRLTEPFLLPIRRVLPDLGGLDLSPLVLILLILFTERLLISSLIWLGGGAPF